jgi:hypothetical protein
MKLNHVVTNHTTGRVIREFGEAKLVRYPDGKHELIGGSTADFAEANEWVSLFAHEIVFSRPGCKPILKKRNQRKLLSFRFRPALSCLR